LAAIAVLAAPSCATPTPFVISGWIFCEGGTTGCNNPAVQVTNATGVSWNAENSSTSNYYQLALTGGAVGDGDSLQFDSAGCLQSKTTPHTVLQAEIDAGGFELNITLEGGVFDPVIISCNGTGAAQDGFCLGDSVWVKGTGLAPVIEYKLWIQNDSVNDGDTLDSTEDPSGLQETVTTETDGSFGPIKIWSAIPAGSAVNYDIVVDDQDGVYNADDDGIDSAGVVGIVAPIPELATFALIGIGLMLVIGLTRFGRRKR